MSIDLHCYSTLTLEDAQSKIEKIRRENPMLIPNTFFITDAHGPIPELGDALPLRLGFKNTKSFFTVGIEDKEKPDSVSEGANLVYSVFGCVTTIVTFFSEYVIESTY